jgi:hypothetical protein
MERGRLLITLPEGGQVAVTVDDEGTFVDTRQSPADTWEPLDNFVADANWEVMLGPKEPPAGNGPAEAAASQA